MNSDLLARARRAVRDPIEAVRKLARVLGWNVGELIGEDTSRSRANALTAYGAKAKAAGVHELLLYLSFDCDTDEDIEAAVELDAWLRQRGVVASYAVPGAQLRKGAVTWRQLADSGSPFLNHGGLPHAEWQGDRYRSITFYDQMGDAAVVADIEEGHRINTEVLGRPPEGFRAPHFGCFQRPDQLALVHRTARRLGYAYCSTTIPSFGLAHGPRVLVDGLVELPCFGSWRYPETILDSWTYLADRRQYRLTDTYAELFVETIDSMRAAKIPGVLTFYADPSHVLGQAPFQRAIEHVVSAGVPSVTGMQLARIAA